MTTFYNFTFKIETTWTKKLVKPILEIWNANDIIVYVWFIYSQLKKFLKICHAINDNSKCTKFTIKN